MQARSWLYCDVSLQIIILFFQLCLIRSNNLFKYGLHYSTNMRNVRAIIKGLIIGKLYLHRKIRSL